MRTKALQRMRIDLVRAARRRKTVKYGFLMKKYGLSRGRRLSQSIGEVDREELEMGAPGFAAIIVRKDTGFPGGGYFCDKDLPAHLRRERREASDPRLTRAEIQHVKSQQRRIWAYYRQRVSR